MSLKITIPIYITYNGLRKLEIIENSQPIPSSDAQRIKQSMLKRQKRVDDYINPVALAKKYQKMIQAENLTQTQLATKLGISRVRITQYLNLLKLPKPKQEFVLRYGDEKLITERSLR